MARLENVNAQHPPDKEYCDDSPRDMDDPVANRFRGAEVEHAAMVAGNPRLVEMARMQLVVCGTRRLAREVIVQGKSGPIL